MSRERLGLGAAIRILDEMKFPTLDEMNFPTHSEVDFDARFWQFFLDFGVTFDEPLRDIGRPGCVIGTPGSVFLTKFRSGF